MKILTLLGIFSLLSAINGYKVLVLGPFNGKSHNLFMQAFVRKLLERSHEVTFVTSISMSKAKIANYTEEELYNSGEKTPFTAVHDIFAFSSASTDFSLGSKNVKEFIKRNDLHFDVVINEEFFHDAFSMFGYKFNAPVVTICPYGHSDFFERQMGLLTPWSHVPHMMLTYTDNMSFAERWYNTVVSAYDWIVRYFLHLPSQNEIAKKHFGHLGRLPSIEEVNSNVSLILVNTHRSLSPVRPSMPRKPLPADIKKFLDESTDGAIFFSLGTVIQGSKMPREKLKSFLNTFKKMKQRILWKYEDESLTEIPSNVMIRKWLPQNDVLAHPNLKAFMTHTGLFGTFEALAHGVPLIMIPFFGDQYRNAKRVINAGYGQMIEFKDINDETLFETMNEVLSNDAYSNKAKELSALFNHNIVHPMDEAMWWIEYVCKFKGAKHMKSHAINMSWFLYLLLDVLIVSLLAVLAVLLPIVFIIKRICCNKKSNRSYDKKRN